MVTLGALIPILGAYIGAAVGVLILLLVHPIDALIFLIFLLILQQVEGNMIYPAWWAPPLAFPPCGPCSRWCSGAACWESPAFFSAHCHGGDLPAAAHLGAQQAAAEEY